MANGLPTAKLGRTNLEVTKLGYGAMEIRGVPRGRDVTSTQADAILNAVLDSGINYIDTSIDYGLSEGFIGQFISNRRDEFILASKCGCMLSGPTVPSGPQPHVYTKENIVAGIEQSLRRMKTEYLDVVQFHGSPSRETLEEHGAIDTLLELRQQGKIRHIGMSGTLPNLPGQIEMGVFDVLQIPYSALERGHEDLITRAAEAGIGNVIRGGVAKGEPGESGVPQPDPWKTFESAGLNELVDEGDSPTDFLLRFTLSHPGMHTTIVGTLNPDHLAQNVAAASKGPLASDVYEQAKKQLEAVGETSATS
jgi:aryl-alcohol dehydrogenase-like predicted oxidoreductase